MNETGIGGRVINYLADTLLVFISSFGLYKWWTFYVIYWNHQYIPWYVFFYATLFLYYTLFEGLFSRTPGKLLSLSHVRNESSGRPSLGQIILRSLLRLTLIDPFFIPLFKRPLHDAWSRTRVVEI